MCERVCVLKAAILGGNISPLTPESCSGCSLGSVSHHCPQSWAHTVSLKAQGDMELSQLCPCWPDRDVPRTQPITCGWSVPQNTFQVTCFKSLSPEVVGHPLFPHLVTLPFSPLLVQRKPKEEVSKARRS